MGLKPSLLIDLDLPAGDDNIVNAVEAANVITLTGLKPQAIVSVGPGENGQFPDQSLRQDGG